MLRKLAGSLLIFIGVVSLFAIFVAKTSGSINFDIFKLLTTPASSLAFVSIGASLFFTRPPTSDRVNYATPRTRAWAAILDSIIISVPMLIIQNWLISETYVGYIVFSIGFAFAVQIVWIYMLVKFGATPGKLAAGIVVVKNNIEAITFRDALIRSSVDLSFVIILLTGQIIAYASISIEEMQSASFAQRGLIVMNNTPLVVIIVMALQQYWTWSEVAVVMFNRRRKAIHDYMAKTVVVYGKKEDIPLLKEATMGINHDPAYTLNQTLKADNGCTTSADAGSDEAVAV